jgi:hypothetical protein
MTTTQPNSRITFTTSTAGRLSASIVAAVLLGVLVAVPVAAATDVAPVHHTTGDAARPHVLTTDIADLLVHIRGGSTCTGTPITGTTFVVTAAHCVLDHNGHVGSRTVLRDGKEYTPTSVLVDLEYLRSVGPLFDAAVLVMDRRIPGPSATLGDVLPTSGTVTLAGFQPLDTDGSLLRGTRYDNRPLPKGATGGVVTIKTAAAGCVQSVSNLKITATQVKVPCGLIPGASGGGLFIEPNNDIVLIGIISTVAANLSYNGVVPLPALHELLNNRTRHTYTMERTASTHADASIVRS